MRRTIWKYSLSRSAFEPGYQTFSMPAGAKIVHVAAQGDQICAWAVVTEDAAPIERHITVVGTGRTIPQLGAVYLGTAQVGAFVGHVFEVFP